MGTETKTKPLYENLDTTFVNLWALLRSLSSRGFIGRVRVELKDYSADVFMTGSSTPLVHEMDRAAGTERLEEAALHRLVLRARETPGTISVFEGADQAVAVQNITPPSPEAAMATEPEAEAASEVIETESATADWPTAESDVDVLLIASSLGDREESSASNEQDLPLVSSGEWTAIVNVSGELIGAVERAVVAVGADFNSIFRAKRLELADDYSFLDPMSNLFDYSNSVATLNHELPLGAYVAGLSEALRRVVDAVAVGERARRLRERVALELLTVARKREDILERSGLRVQLDRIAGTEVI